LFANPLSATLESLCLSTTEKEVPEWMEMMKNRPELCLKANQKIAQRMKHGQFPYSKEFEQDSDGLA
jgi:hypothetical protein